MSANEPAKDEVPPQPPAQPAPIVASPPAQAASRSADEATALLRAAVRKRRPWNLGALLLTIAFFGVPLALLVWLVATTTKVPPLDVVAFDQITVSGKTAAVCAQLVPDEEGSHRLRGLEVHFIDTQPAGGAKSFTLLTDAHGLARCDWPLADDERLAEIEVRYIDAERKQSAHARARLFAWPRTTKILLVEVDALTDAAGDFWRRDDLAQRPVLREAARTLKAAVDHRWQIVYLATGPDRPLGYQRLRDFWIARRVGDNADTEIPGGPVLGRSAYDVETTSQSAQRDVTAQLNELFAGPLLAVARNADSVSALREAGMTTFEITADAESWQHVRKSLNSE